MSSTASGAPENAPLQLQDDEGLLWTLARNSSDCVKLIDLDGRIVRWNPACEALYGWDAHEVVGTKLPQIPRDQRLRVLADIRSIASAGHIVERETETVRRDGSHLYMRLTVVPVNDLDGHPAGVLTVGVQLGVDERLESQRAELVALIGKRLTEPLAKVASNARLLLRPEIGADNGRRMATAAALAAAAESSAEFLETLLITSGLQAGRLRASLEPVDLGQLVTDIVARAGDGRVLVDFDPALQPISADRRLLAHAVGTLLELALLVTPPNEHVSASVHKGRGVVLIEICDRGPRMSGDEPRLLTKSPYAGEDVRGGDGGAMALGYAAAIAHLHGARFQIRPVTPSGARYTIEFEESPTRKDATK